MSDRLTPEFASHLARLSLGHVARPWPHALQHVLTGPEDLRSPQTLHPIFYGSFDWHSCVHGYWLLARALRRYPSLPEAAEIQALFDRQLVSDKIDGELAYLRRPASRGFERPYGWAWLLMLAGELTLLGADRIVARWSTAIRPLAGEFVERFKAFLPLANYPVRAGTHGNTAFAIVLAHQYARVVGESELAALCTDKARQWYGNDQACQAWEPCLNDFLSPALVEAACMRNVLPPEEFRSWLRRFLAALDAGEPRTLFAPAHVSDRTDGQISHLDGLNLSRAWCWRLIVEGLEDNDPLRPRLLRAAEEHLEASLPHLADSYAGEHWLATFAALALDL